MSDENRTQYWDGNKNKAIRYWFYNQRGLELFNQFKYLVAAIFALYFACRLENPLWIILMFVVAMPVLTLMGWVQVHHIGKVVEWLTLEFSTHFGRYQITLLEEIRDAIKDKNKVD